MAIKNFTYTPRTGADASVSDHVTIDFNNVEGYDNMEQVLDDLASKSIRMYVRKDKDGNTPKSVCTVLFGKLDWNPIEGLRRSSEFHALVDEYGNDNPGIDVEKWKLSQEGRKPSNGRNNVVDVSIELEEGRELDGSYEEAVEVKDPVNHKDGTTTYAFTLKTREIPVEVKVKRETRAQLKERAVRLEAELEALKKAVNGS